MKFSKKLIAACQRDYKETNAGRPIMARIENLFFTSQFPEANGRRPSDWAPERVMATRLPLVTSGGCWRERAFALRVMDEDVPAFALNLALALRADRLTQSGEDADVFASVWNVLAGLAINDVAFVQACHDHFDYPKKGAESYFSLANAVYYGFRGELAKLKATMKRPTKGRCEPWVAGLVEAAAGIAEGNPTRVAKGLNHTLGKPETTNILTNVEFNLRAQGLAMLARRIDPALLSEFDVEQGAPWDAELWAWATANTPDVGSIDVSRLSLELQETWIELAKPRWYSRRPQYGRYTGSKPLYGLSKAEWDAAQTHAPHLLQTIGGRWLEEQEFRNIRNLPAEQKPPPLPNDDEAEDREWLAMIVERAAALDPAGALRLEGPASSPKNFWTIKRAGRHVVTCFGRIGEEGKVDLKVCDTPAEAEAEAAKLIAAKKAVGYVESVAASPEKSSTKRKPTITVRDMSEREGRSLAKRIVERHASYEASKKSAKAKPAAAAAAKKKSAPAKAPKAKAASGSRPRRFEFEEGSSNKFWSVSRTGKSVTTTWGRLGTDGQTKTKDFVSEEAAVREVEKLIREKTGKGYVES